jgi:NAD(P)-dependent dehydrogenase (short-subunit alcohol dehydrogenase family)
VRAQARGLDVPGLDTRRQVHGRGHQASRVWAGKCFRSYRPARDHVNEAYVNAKHGLEGLSKVIALEGAARSVTSNCISPGYVRTPLVEKLIADQARVHGIPEDQVLESVILAESAVKRLVEPAEVAGLVLWLAGPQASMSTGSTFTLDGGWTAK